MGRGDSSQRAADCPAAFAASREVSGQAVAAGRVIGQRDVDARRFEPGQSLAGRARVRVGDPRHHSGDAGGDHQVGTGRAALALVRARRERDARGRGGPAA